MKSKMGRCTYCGRWTRIAEKEDGSWRCVGGCEEAHFEPEKEWSVGKYSKAIGAGVGGAISTVLLWAVSVVMPDLKIPVEVSAALTTLVTALLVYAFPANTT